jgi:hypothetical protein
MNDGEMWTFVRSVLSQGATITQGHLGGLKYPDFEAYNRKLDEVARERAEELALRIGNDSLRMALKAIMNYPEIREYIGSELSRLADAAMETPNIK